jgi:hypothetical protein
MDRITRQPPRQQGYGSTSSVRNDSLTHTRKHERRRKESNQGTKLSASGGLSAQAGRIVRKGRADSPARCRGQSATDTRTVRQGATDRPLKTTEPPEPTEKNGPSAKTGRTVRAGSDRPLLKLGPSANRLQRKPKTNRIESKDVQEHDEHAKNTQPADRTPPPRGPSAAHGQSGRPLDPEGQLSQSITRSPKR